MSSNLWSEDEIFLLEKYYEQGMMIYEVSKRLGRSMSSVQTKGNRMRFVQSKRVCSFDGCDIVLGLNCRSGLCKKHWDMKYTDEHMMEILKNNRKWRNNNRERYVESNQRYYKKNREKFLKKTSDWQKENPDKVRLRNKRYEESHPEVKRMSYRRYRARKLNAKGSHTTEEWLAIKKATRGWCNGWNRSKHFVGVDNITQDHIIALNNHGTDYADNLQGLCLSCNSAKRDVT